MSDAAFRVRVEKGPGKGSKHKFGSNSLVLGTHESADVVIDAPGVSPRHAKIVFDGGKVILEDLGSEEGTFRNEKRLLGPVNVFPGDRIGLGPEVTLILEGDDPSAVASQTDEEQNPGLVPGESGEV